MNVEFIFRSWGIHVQELKEVWFGIPIGSSEEPDTVYKYNYVTQTVYKDQPSTSVTTASLFTKTADETWDSDPESWDSDTSIWDSNTALALHKRVIWGVGDTGLSVERIETSNFNGTAISSYWQSKDITAADFEMDDAEGRLMEWQGIEVIAKGTSVTVSYSTDEGASWTTAKTLTLSSAFPTDSSPLMVYFRVTSSKLRIRFSDASTSGAFEIKQFRVMALPREERQ